MLRVVSRPPRSPQYSELEAIKQPTSLSPIDLLRRVLLKGKVKAPDVIDESSRVSSRVSRASRVGASRKSQANASHKHLFSAMHRSLCSTSRTRQSRTSRTRQSRTTATLFRKEPEVGVSFVVVCESAAAQAQPSTLPFRASLAHETRHSRLCV